MHVWDLRNEHQNVRSKFQAQSADGFVSPEWLLWIPDQARLQLSDTVETCGRHKMLETCGTYSSVFINIHQSSNIFQYIPCTHMSDTCLLSPPCDARTSLERALTTHDPQVRTELSTTPGKQFRASCGNNPQSFFYIIMDKEKG